LSSIAAAPALEPSVCDRGFVPSAGSCAAFANPSHGERDHMTTGNASREMRWGRPPGTGVRRCDCAVVGCLPFCAPVSLPQIWLPVIAVHDPFVPRGTGGGITAETIVTVH
jgi:hypothetical protein